jgi:hypothetical protein
MADNQTPRETHLEFMLDEALEESFPASDPPSLLQPHRQEDTPEDPIRR